MKADAHLFRAGRPDAWGNGSPRGSGEKSGVAGRRTGRFRPGTAAPGIGRRPVEFVQAADRAVVLAVRGSAPPSRRSAGRTDADPGADRAGPGNSDSLISGSFAPNRPKRVSKRGKDMVRRKPAAQASGADSQRLYKN